MGSGPLLMRTNHLGIQAIPGRDYATEQSASTAHLPRYPEGFHVSMGVMDTGRANLPYTDVANPLVPRKGVALFNHGAFCLPPYGETVVRLLADTGFVVRSPVLRGHGVGEGRAYATDGSRFGDTVPAMVLEDMPAVVAQAIEDFGERLVLAGYSLGGEVNARYAQGVFATGSPWEIADTSEAVAQERAEQIRALIFIGAPFGEAQVGNPLWEAGKLWTKHYDRVPGPLMFPRVAQEIGAGVMSFLSSQGLLLTPDKVRRMHCLRWTALAMSLRGMVDIGNLTFEESLRISMATGPVSNEIARWIYRFMHGKPTSKYPAFDRSAVSNIVTPAAFIYADGDPFANVPQAMLARDNLRERGVPTQMIVQEGFDHGDLVFGEEAYRALSARMPEIMRFIEEHGGRR